MGNKLLLSLTLLCAIPALNAQLPATKAIKGHVVTRAAQSKPYARPLSNLNPRLAPEANGASLFESFETGGDKKFQNG